MEHFTTKDLCQMLDISHQTVKVWSREFRPYLSPTATPEANKRRHFTIDDVRVFDLVRDYRERNYTYEDIHGALRSGQRGNIPDTASAIIPTVMNQQLALFREQVALLQHQLTEAVTERDETRGQNKLLKEQSAEKDQRIAELQEQIWRLKQKLEG